MIRETWDQNDLSVLTMIVKNLSKNGTEVLGIISDKSIPVRFAVELQARDLSLGTDAPNDYLIQRRLGNMQKVYFLTFDDFLK